MDDYLGAHMSISGGLHLAIDRGVEAGCGVIQLFTQNTRGWQGKAVSAADADLFRKKRQAAGILDVVSHDIYLVNLGAPPGEIREKSIAAFREEMERCGRLGIDKIVMHPGSHNGDGEAVGIRRIIEALDLLIPAAGGFAGRILLETTAGQGTNLGYRFPQLQEIIAGSAFPERFGVCLDTCHVFAAGYDISTRDGYERTMEEFDRVIGLDRLMAFHLNDTKKGLASRVDRHEHIGKGALGLEPFRLLLRDARFQTVPKLLETPKGDDSEMDAANLATLRGLLA